MAEAPRGNDAVRREFARRTATIEREWNEEKHKRDSAGKFAKKTAGEREQARKEKALKRKTQRINERWGDNPKTREKALRDSLAGDIPKGDYERIEQEFMAKHGVTDRNQLYANVELFDKLQERFGHARRARSGQRQRARDSQRAFDAAHPDHDPTRSSDETQVDRRGGKVRGKPAPRGSKRDRSVDERAPSRKPKETAAQSEAYTKGFFKTLAENPGFRDFMDQIVKGAGKPVKGGRKNDVDSKLDAIKKAKGSPPDHIEKLTGLGNPDKTVEGLRKLLGKKAVRTYEDGSSLVSIEDNLYSIPPSRRQEDSDTTGPKGANSTPFIEERKKKRARRASAARTFPVPATLASAWLGTSATLDEIDVVARHNSDAGAWARRVQANERDGVLVGALGGARTLPFGVVVPVDEIDADIVVALAAPGRGIIAGAIPPDSSIEYLTLDEDEVAFTLRALNVDKVNGVILRASTPVAFLTRSAITAAATDLPPGSKLIAVVDPLDKNAVLDLVAVTPGPKVLRRNDGRWEPDPSWVSILRSVRPPPVVEVTDALAASVIAQVDEATKGQPFEETVLGSGEHELFMTNLETEADLAALTLLPILAAQGRVKSEVYDVAGVMPAQLQRYWLYGGGAAKIRWGTPGAWRRCHRLLTKYMGPFKSRGACTNLGQKLGGRGVAWDVGS